MKYHELKEKSLEDLTRLFNELTHKMRELRFKDANKQLKNVRELRATRKTIARLKTLMSSKQ